MFFFLDNIFSLPPIWECEIKTFSQNRLISTKCSFLKNFIHDDLTQNILSWLLLCPMWKHPLAHAYLLLSRWGALRSVTHFSTQELILLTSPFARLLREHVCRSSTALRSLQNTHIPYILLKYASAPKSCNDAILTLT